VSKKKVRKYKNQSTHNTVVLKATCFSCKKQPLSGFAVQKYMQKAIIQLQLQKRTVQTRHSIGTCQVWEAFLHYMKVWGGG